MAKTTPAQAAAAARYKSAHYDQIILRVPKGRRADLAAAAAASGAGSLAAWLLGLAERETGLELVLRGELPYKAAGPAGAAADPGPGPGPEKK